MVHSSTGFPSLKRSYSALDFEENERKIIEIAGYKTKIDLLESQHFPSDILENQNKVQR